VFRIFGLPELKMKRAGTLLIINFTQLVPLFGRRMIKKVHAGSCPPAGGFCRFSASKKKFKQINNSGIKKPLQNKFGTVEKI